MFGKFVFLKILIFLISIPSIAAQYAEVVTDGAMVYKRADFGSDILGYLRVGKQVKVSNKSYGAFYRVKLKQGIIGYVSDVDVRATNSGKLSFDNIESSKSKNGGKKPKSQGKPSKPILASKYMGVGLGILPFVDRLPVDSSEVTASSSTVFLTFKYSKPLEYLDGVMISDFNFGISTSTPKLYERFSEDQPSGYVLIADYNWLKPVYSLTKRNYSVYWGAGLTAIYSNISVGVLSGSTVVSVPASELRIGAVFMAGFSARIGSNWAFKIEPKLYWEKEKFVGVLLGLQKSY